jgi:hypothetical protein
VRSIYNKRAGTAANIVNVETKEKRGSKKKKERKKERNNINREYCEQRRSQLFFFRSLGRAAGPLILPIQTGKLNSTSFTVPFRPIC